jgi:hypothetical protein
VRADADRGATITATSEGVSGTSAITVTDADPVAKFSYAPSAPRADVFVFTPSSLGSTTLGTFPSALFFDGSLYGLGSNDVFAIDLP